MNNYDFEIVSDLSECIMHAIVVNALKIAFLFLTGVPSLKRLCLKALHPIVTRYDLHQLDLKRKRQIEEYCHQIKCNNTFQMSSISLL